MINKCFLAFAIMLFSLFFLTGLAHAQYVLLEQNFEQGFGDWENINYSGPQAWELDDPTGLNPPGFSPVYVSFDTLDSSESEKDILLSPTFDSSNCDTYTLTLDLCVEGGTNLVFWSGGDMWEPPHQCTLGLSHTFESREIDNYLSIEYIKQIYHDGWVALDNIVLTCNALEWDFNREDPYLLGYNDPGNVATFRFTVINHTDSENTVSFNYSSVLGWETAGPDSLVVPAQSSITFPVEVTIADVTSDVTEITTVTMTVGEYSKSYTLGSFRSWHALAELPYYFSTSGLAYDGLDYFYLYQSNQKDSPSSFLRYDKQNNAYVVLPKADTPTSHAPICLMDGKIYTVGGTSSSGEITDLFQIYNIDAQTWTYGPPLPDPPGPIHLSAAACDPDRNRVWILGGYFSNYLMTRRLIYYDVEEEEWINSGIALMPYFSADFQMIYRDDRLYTYGGKKLSYYDINANQWTQTGELNGRRLNGAYGIFGDLEVIVGGWDGQSTWYFYWDIEFDTVLYRHLGEQEFQEMEDILLPSGMAPRVGVFDENGVFYLFGIITDSEGAQVYSTRGLSQDLTMLPTDDDTVDDDIVDDDATDDDTVDDDAIDDDVIDDDVVDDDTADDDVIDDDIDDDADDDDVIDDDVVDDDAADDDVIDDDIDDDADDDDVIDDDIDDDADDDDDDDSSCCG